MAFVQLTLQEIPPRSPRFAETRSENLGLHRRAARTE